MTKHPTGIYVGCLVKVIRKKSFQDGVKESVINYSPFVLQHP
ncbi:hypothetical protein ACLB1S_15040 [Escherichia coli]